jgi:exodeoxyribonuclease-3
MPGSLANFFPISHLAPRKHTMTLTRRFAILVLLLASTLGLASAQKTLRVLSYNVEDGLHHGANVDQFITWVKEQKPDIALLQEMNGFTPAKLTAFAKQYGHRYSVLSKTTGYPVAITSRYPITVLKIQNAPMTHSYIHARIHGYDVMVLHLNPHDQHIRSQEIQLVVKELATIPASHKIILAGDFNSMNSHDGASLTPKEIEHLRQLEQKRPILHNLVNNEPDFSIMATVEATGLIDAYRLDCGQDQPGYAVNHPFIEHRIDYIWVSPSLKKKVLSCSFIYDAVTAHLSDHHPLFIVLGK